MPSSGRMALGLLFLTGCAARRFSLAFIRPRTASPNRPKPSAIAAFEQNKEFLSNPLVTDR